MTNESATRIRAVKGRIVYNSRGEETIEVEVYLEKVFGRASAPSGASVGKHEVVSFPPHGPQGSLRALSRISKRVIGMNASDYRALNSTIREVDGTFNYSRVGGSLAYVLTMAAVEAVSKARGRALFETIGSGPFFLPLPLGNVLGGGRHAGKGAPDIQEYLVCPTRAKSFREALAANVEVHREVRRILETTDDTFAGGRGDEGAWVPRMDSQKAAEVVWRAVRAVEGKTGLQIRLGLDVASASLWDPKEAKYVYGTEGVRRGPGEQLEFVKGLIRDFDIFYLEDPFHEEAFEETAELTRSIKNIFICGDDLFVTSKNRLMGGSELGAGNAAILKVNQAGGLGDAWDFVDLAHKSGYVLVTSHRSGDVPEPIIAHIAIASRSKLLKAGVVGGERVSKLNELIRVEEDYPKMSLAALEIRK